MDFQENNDTNNSFLEKWGALWQEPFPSSGWQKRSSSDRKGHEKQKHKKENSIVLMTHENHYFMLVSAADATSDPSVIQKIPLTQ